MTKASVAQLASEMCQRPQSLWFEPSNVVKKRKYDKSKLIKTIYNNKLHPYRLFKVINIYHHDLV